MHRYTAFLDINGTTPSDRNEELGSQKPEDLLPAGLLRRARA
jgi:hypothetical protein